MHGAIVTNGFKVKECAAELVQQGWDLMFMSQDGTHEIHRQNRPGANEKFDSYQMLRDGTVELVEQRRKQNKKFPVVVTLMCITSINQRDLLNTVLDAQAMGIDAMVLYPAWFTTLEDGLKHEADFERRFGSKPFMWKGYVADCHDVDVPALQDELRRIQADPRVTIPWTLMPDISLEQLDPYYHDHSNFLGYYQCFYPWTYIEIQPNGDVSTCRDYGDYICGNITQSSIFEIFNNDRYQKFRKSLREDGMMPICSRCCGLMGF
jgi:radical SAM protein with 4Fe4S-binding SPASM domain